MAVTTRWAAWGETVTVSAANCAGKITLTGSGIRSGGKSLKLLVTITSAPPTQCSRHHVFVFVVGQPERAVQASQLAHDGAHQTPNSFNSRALRPLLCEDSVVAATHELSLS